MLCDYVYGITGDRAASDNFTALIVQLNIPIKTFSTAIKLYKRLNIHGHESRSNGFYTSKGMPDIYYYKSATLDTGLRSNMVDSIASRYKDVIFAREMLANTFLLLVACSLIAYKYHKDVPYTNEVWAQTAGLDYRRLNGAERQILFMLDYRLGFKGDEKIADEIRPYLYDERSIIWFDRRPYGSKKSKSMLHRIFCTQ